MQLKQFTNINLALATAACALVGAPAQADDLLKDWQFDTALMYYGEVDRVMALEGIVEAQKDFGDEHVLTTKLVFDTLTGASATGAVAQPYVQTFTRPSGEGQYVSQAGETPLDDTFRDTRVQLSAAWSQPWGEQNHVSGGVNLSNEYDYLSLSVNGQFARDFNQNNTTLSLGMSYAIDSISPEGGRPIALSDQINKADYDEEDERCEIDDDGEYDGLEHEFETCREAGRLSGDGTKNTLDLMLGLTQVINRRWLVQFNYGISQVDGYLNDPFKLVSYVDNQGYLQRNVYESRPDKRVKNNFFAQSKYHFEQSILDLSYRFSSDDWGINSHTVDTRWRFPLSETAYITPHVRYYQQSAADFYQPFLLTNESPDFASADYRIGKMSTYTVGLKFGQTLDNGHEYGVRFEYYLQTPESNGTQAVGVLNQVDLYPSISAVVLQFNYSF